MSKTPAAAAAGDDNIEILYHVEGKVPTTAQLLAAQKSYGHMYSVGLKQHYKGRQGRYDLTDTARKTLLGNVVLGDLRYGKLPSQEDSKWLLGGQ